MMDHWEEPKSVVEEEATAVPAATLTAAPVPTAVAVAAPDPTATPVATEKPAVASMATPTNEPIAGATAGMKRQSAMALTPTTREAGIRSVPAVTPAAATATPVPVAPTAVA